jgi:hypothetical protein
MTPQRGFFPANFDQYSSQCKRRSQKAADSSYNDCGAQYAKEQAAIDGMSLQTVRAADHQFLAAPVVIRPAQFLPSVDRAQMANPRPIPSIAKPAATHTPVEGHNRCST